MLFNVCRDICAVRRVKHVYYPDIVWGYGGDVVKLCYEPTDAAATYAAPIVYLGNREPIRSLPPSFLSESSVLLMVRDPRDCLVSMYFSFLGSHTAPGHLNEIEKRTWLDSVWKKRAETAIDNYVIEKSQGYLKNLQAMLAFAHMSANCIVIKYEDYILDKKMLCNCINAVIDSLQHSAESERVLRSLWRGIRDQLLGRRSRQMDRITRKHTFIPTRESQGQHIRQALPGDHRTKLQKGTVQKLDLIFGEILNKFNYE